MKKIAIVPVVLTVLLAATISSWSQTNILENGSFEQFTVPFADPGGVPTAWSRKSQTSVRSTDFVKCGDYSLRVDGSGNWVKSDPIPVSRGVSYEAGGYVRRTAPGCYASIWIQYYNSNNTWVGGSHYASATGPLNEWEYVSLNARAPMEAQYAVVQCYSAGISVGTMYFDGLSFRRSPTPSVDDTDGSFTGTFHNYGPPARISEHRGALIVDCGNGNYNLLINLSDISGQYAILMVDPFTGESTCYDYPEHKAGETGFAHLYSKSGLIYTQYGNAFFEFDPKKGEFTYHTKCTEDERCAMMLTEGDDGVIWMATYPKSNLMSFDPKSRKYTDYGAINTETWSQYPRGLAVDDAGWVYLGIGLTKSQVVAFDPATRTIKKLVPEEERVLGDFSIYVNPHIAHPDKAILWRGVDGKIYAHMATHGENRPWFRFYKGEVERVDAVSSIQPVEQRASYQLLQDPKAPIKLPNDGIITDLDVPGKAFNFTKPDGTMQKVIFDYPSQGPRIASMWQGSDGRIYGSTGLPLQFFALDPLTGSYALAPKVIGGHINAFASMGDSLYGAIYTQGVLVRHIMSKDPKNMDFETLAQAGDDITRPYGLLPLSNGNDLVMFGSPAYGTAGGGLMFYDTKTFTKKIVPHSEVVPDQCTKAMVELPNGNLVGGTSIEAGTGGQPPPDAPHVANLYIMDMPSKQVIFREPLIPGTPQYRDLLVGANGLVYGLSATNGNIENPDYSLGGYPHFFVFDPVSKTKLHDEQLPATYGALTGGQAPRVMLMGADGKIYLLLQNYIVRIDPKTYKHERLAKTPFPVDTGVAIRGDEFFFSSGSELWSYRIPAFAKTQTGQ